jgi:hypothetical protein
MVTHYPRMDSVTRAARAVIFLTLFAGLVELEVNAGYGDTIIVIGIWPDGRLPVVAEAGRCWMSLSASISFLLSSAG